MTPTITAFESSPDRGRGLARDMRVRWALEEVGQPYEVRLVSFTEMKEPAHRARQACFRRSIGGFHWQATDRLMRVSSGLNAVIALRHGLRGCAL